MLNFKKGGKKLKNNNLISIRVEQVEDHVSQKKFFRVIINEEERLINILESEKDHQILKYKSIIQS